MKSANNLATRRTRWAAGTVLMLAGAFAGAPTASAQSSISGGLGNFDAANFEGVDVHGMEIQIDGIQLADLAPSWCGNKYNCPVLTAYPGGVYVRYVSPYDSVNHMFTATTVQHPPNTAFAGTCYMITAAYTNAGCDHFGVHLQPAAFTKATTTAYRWMVEDANNPGTLVALPHNLFVPTPVYTWLPPALPTNPPVLQVEIQLPDPPPPPPALPPQFGNATWMKVYKTDMGREVALTELTSDNPIVPQTVAQIETEWVLMQPAPPPAPGDNRKRRNRQTNSGGVNTGTHSVLRRYETYAYTGAYDPLTHEVVCGGDGTCTIPQAGELGDMIVAQMVAANVDVPGLTIALTGTGTVSSSDKVISCGSKCASNYAAGTLVTLTAKAGSNSTFAGWTGACGGTSLTCTVTIANATTVNALFTANAAGGGGGGATGGGGGGSTTQFTLQVARSNSGTVTSDVAGINCGSTCSAKYDAGSTVTLTATPPAGKTFVGWSNACSGTAPTCTLTINANATAQANFSK